MGVVTPSIYHWYNAADLGVFEDMLVASNIASTGSAAVGTFHGLGAFGTYDMAACGIDKPMACFGRASTVSPS